MIRASNLTLTSSESVSWPDYVFDEGYELPSLNEVEAFVTEHNHLPGIPSATDVAAKGVEVNEMIALQLEKIEELTLYVIALEKENSLLRARDREFHQRIEALEQK